MWGVVVAASLDGWDQWTQISQVSFSVRGRSSEETWEKGREGEMEFSMKASCPTGEVWPFHVYCCLDYYYLSLLQASENRSHI